MILALIIALLSSRQIAAIKNRCHKSCEPLMCNGPTSNNCLECIGNKVPLNGKCICDKYYFGGDCETLLVGCIQANEDLSCVRCETPRDILQNGACQRNFETYWFLPEGTKGFDKKNPPPGGSTSFLYTYYERNCSVVDDNYNCAGCFEHCIFPLTNRLLLHS